MEEDFEIPAQVVAVLTCAEPWDEQSGSYSTGLGLKYRDLLSSLPLTTCVTTGKSFLLNVPQK